MVEACESGICLLIQPQWQVFFVSCASNRPLHAYMPLFRVVSEICCVVWMYVGIVLIIVLKMLQSPMLSSELCGNEIPVLPYIRNSYKTCTWR